MRNSHYCPILLAVCACMAVPTEALPQAPPDDIGDLIHEVRRTGYALKARDILSQNKRSYPPAFLDAIADSLSAIASAEPAVSRFGSRADTLLASRVVFSAMQALAGAGSEHARIPYAGAFSSLIAIAEGSSDLATRASALFAMSRLSARDQAVEYVGVVAESDSRLAEHAVGTLARQMGEEGIAKLRALYLTNSVQNSRAKSALGGIARHHGWRAP